MPIVLTSATKKPAPSSCGIIIFRRDPETGAIDGTFALPSVNEDGHDDAVLARESGRPIGDVKPSDFVGKYAVTTLCPDGTKFSDGVMTVTPMGDQGIYQVIWDLAPVEKALLELGYIPGTRLIYKAVGLTLNNGAELSVAWDNMIFERDWPGKSSGQASPG
jgi:hypothetical protein